MGLFDNDMEKFSKAMVKAIRCFNDHGLCDTSKIFDMATKNPQAWDSWLLSFSDSDDTVENYIQRMSANFISCCSCSCPLTHDCSEKEQSKWDYYNNQMVFWAQSAYKLSIMYPNVSVKTRKIIYCLDSKYISSEQRWQLLYSLVNDGDEWAEAAISSAYVISILNKDSLFPSDKLDFGLSLTKKTIQKILEKYTDVYLSNLKSNDIAHDALCDNRFGVSSGDLCSFTKSWDYRAFNTCIVRTEIIDDIIILFGFGHISLNNNVDALLALQSLDLASKIVDKINTKDRNVQIYSESKLSIFCRVSDNELAELQYRVGSNYELFANTLDDYQQAITYYKLAANSGHPAAMFSLAKVYYSGLGVAPKNEQNTKFWLKKAIDADVVEAIQFQNEHPELKEDGVKNISYHAEGDIIQGNSGIIAKDDAVVNRANIGGDANSSAQEYKFCMYCGAKLPAEARFCMKCGKKQE